MLYRFKVLLVSNLILSKTEIASNPRTRLELPSDDNAARTNSKASTSIGSEKGIRVATIMGPWIRGRSTYLI